MTQQGVLYIVSNLRSDVENRGGHLELCLRGLHALARPFPLVPRAYPSDVCSTFQTRNRIPPALAERFENINNNKTGLT
jgi:hypothetical protein